MAKVDCGTARAALKEAPLDTSILEALRPAQNIWDAILHYACCPDCRPMGLAAIREQHMRCEEAVKIAVAGRDLLYDVGNNTCTTLGEFMAHEHIYGKTAIIKGAAGNMVACVPRSVLTGLVDPCIDTHPCIHKVCSDVRRIWIDAPLSLQYDGDREVAHGIEWTLSIAQEAGWDIGPLLHAAPAKKLGRFKSLLFPA